MTAETTSELRNTLASFEARARALGASGNEAAKILRRMRNHTERLASFRADQAQEAFEAAAEEARRASELAEAAAASGSSSRSLREAEEAEAAAARSDAAKAAAEAAEEAARAARADAWSARLWNDPPIPPHAAATAAAIAPKGKRNASRKAAVVAAAAAKTEAEADVDTFISHMRREALRDEEKRRRGEAATAGGLVDGQGDEEGEEEREQRALWLSLGDKEKLALPLPCSSPCPSCPADVSAPPSAAPESEGKEVE